MEKPLAEAAGIGWQGKHTNLVSRRHGSWLFLGAIYTTLDLGLGYKFGGFGWAKGAKVAVNITNLTDARYAANFDNSVFAPTDAPGGLLVFHASAPRQFFITFGASL